MKQIVFTLTFLCLSQGVFGQTLNFQENFANNIHEDTSNTTAVWNYVLNVIHPPLAVSLTDGQNNEDSLDADVGNGQDGAFDISTYSKFSVNQSTLNNVITIDTNAHPVLQFTSFNLASGWQIEGTGSNPLWIKVLGSVTIAGTIDCSGGSGQGTSSNITTISQGGTGRCGGGSGGSGGTSISLAGTGSAGGTSVSGGVGGTSAATGTGGGGGGGYSSFTGSNGYIGGATTGGAKGGNFTDPTFSIFGPQNGIGGGSGGGGGGYSTAGFSGGGGGAGGGVIRITAVGNITITSTGALLARAGSGGGGVSGAGGGGGAGGGIWLQTPGTITNSGTIDASSPTSSPNGGVAGNNGGFGTNGRTWLTSSASIISGNAENPQSDRFGQGPCFCAGEVHYSVASYQVQTLSYDLGNTSPTPLSLSLLSSLPGTSTATIVVAGSNDNFVTDNTGYVLPGQISILSTKRYLRFQMSLQLVPSGFASTPATISAVNLSYTGHTQNQFNLNSSCGTLSGPLEFLDWIFMFTLLFWITTGRLRKQVLRLQRCLWVWS